MIIVNPETKIGNYCIINQGVSIGITYDGKYPGVPKLGNNVYIGPGAKIIGGIEIVNNVSIGANAVVLAPVLDNSVVVGIPGRIISSKGSGSYVANTVSSDKF